MKEMTQNDGLAIEGGKKKKKGGGHRDRRRGMSMSD
jgi:hypothetical protein